MAVAVTWIRTHLPLWIVVTLNYRYVVLTSLAKLLVGKGLGQTKGLEYTE